MVLAMGKPLDQQVWKGQKRPEPPLVYYVAMFPPTSWLGGVNENSHDGHDNISA